MTSHECKQNTINDGLFDAGGESRACDLEALGHNVAPEMLFHS